MPLRLAEIVVPSEAADELEALLASKGSPLVARHSLDGGLAKLDTLCTVADTEVVLDAVEDRFSKDEGFRVVLIAVEASLPRIEEERRSDPPEESEGEGETKTEEATARARDRVHREEVYSALGDAAGWSKVYLVTVALSTIVAAVGLIQSSTAVIIGAMVIAPLLGPNMALALGTTLGDRGLIFKALKTGSGGLIIGMAISLATGAIFRPDLGVPEIASRTHVSLADLVLALASGAAGALAFTTGAPAALIGVMVAVALMPPLVVFGLTLSTLDFSLATGPGLLLFANIICVNLAATITFRVQGLGPREFWEDARARRLTWIATTVWTVLLTGAVVWILLAEL